MTDLPQTKPGRKTQSVTTILRVTRRKKKNSSKKTRSSSWYTDSVSEPLRHEDLFNVHEQLTGNICDLHHALLGLGDESVTHTQTDAEPNILTDKETRAEKDGRTDELTNSHKTRSRTVWYIP